MTIESAFAKLLVELRVANEFTQADLALRAGIARSFISLMERGQRNPTIETIFRIAQAVDLHPEELVKRLRLHASEKAEIGVIGNQERDNPRAVREPEARTLLAINVQQMRKKAGLTQKELADLAGIHSTTVSQIERCIHNAPDIIQKLAGAFSVPVARLFEARNPKKLESRGPR